LLRRDYIVGTETDILYAISWLKHTSISNSQVEDNINVHGGTAWAVMSFINNCIKFLNDNKKQGLFNLPCYIYDQNIKKWYQVRYNLDIEFIITDKVPLLKELNIGIKFGGIGTREINQDGINEIKKLFL